MAINNMGRDTSKLIVPGTFGHAVEQANLAAVGTEGSMLDPKTFLSQNLFRQQNVIPFVLNAPGWMYYIPDENLKRHTLRAFKSIIETRAHTISGLDSTINVESSETPMGVNSGSVIYTPKKITQTPSLPSFGFPEGHNRAISNFHSAWINTSIASTNSTQAKIYTMVKDTLITDTTSNMYGASILFVEPDVSHNIALKTYLGQGLYPETSGTITSSKTKDGFEPPMLEIVYKGTIFTDNDDITKLGNALLAQISKFKTTYGNQTVGITGPSATMTSSANGYVSTSKSS